MTLDPDEDVLAGEYVLGTLDSFARAEAQALMGLDPAFAEAVRRWERRLGELAALIPSREPPAAVWERLKGPIATEAAERKAGQRPPAESEAQPENIPAPEPNSGSTPESGRDGGFTPQPDSIVFAAPIEEASRPSVPPEASEADDQSPESETAVPAGSEASANIARLRRRLGRWRGMAVVFGLLAASLLAFVVVREVKPEILPARFHPKVVEVTKVVEKVNTVEVEVPGPVPAEFVAVLQKDESSPENDESSPAFLLSFDIGKQTVTARRLGAGHKPGKSYELWLVSDKFPAPRSLGVIGAEPFTVRPIGGYDAVTLNRANYAVSLEPQGGSPTGAPSGPLLYSGKLIQVTPPGMASSP